METNASGNRFVIWGIDRAAYGPVELPMLVDWIKDERVTADTWLFVEREEAWQKAAQIPELQMFFRSKGATPSFAAKAGPGVSHTTAIVAVRPGVLRRVKIFSEFKDADLERFVQFMEVLRVGQWTQIVKQGDHGETMFLVLEGELRVRLMVGDKEKILATLGVGEFFGEMALFDQGLRSADVIANQDSLLLKIAASAFAKLAQEAPELASPFLLAIGRTLSARIRADNKRYRDSVAFARAAGP